MPDALSAYGCLFGNIRNDLIGYYACGFGCRRLTCGLFSVNQLKVDLSVAVHTCSRRDKLSYNYIFLKTDKVVDLALYCGLGEDSCGLLERGCRQK